MAQELSPGGGVSGKHRVAELAHLGVQRDVGHQHPARLAQHLAGQERRRPRALRHTAPQTQLIHRHSIEPSVQRFCSMSDCLTLTGELRLHFTAQRTAEPFCCSHRRDRIIHSTH